MKDINEQTEIEKKIIGSILKDEIKSLPDLLRNHVLSIEKNKDINNNFNNKYDIYNTNSRDNYINEMDVINNYMIKKFNGNNHNINHNIESNFNINKEMKGYDSQGDSISQRANKLVNLNFLVSSNKRNKSNINYGYNYNNYGINNYNNKMSYNKYLRELENDGKNSLNSKYISRKYDNFMNMDYINMNGNNSKTIYNYNKKGKSFKIYLKSKLDGIESTKGSRFFKKIVFLILNYFYNLYNIN